MSQKYNAALGAYELISKNNGPIVLGIGTGSTTDFFTKEFLPKLREKLKGIYSSSYRTTNLLKNLGFNVQDYSPEAAIDIYIDGADEVDKNFNLIIDGLDLKPGRPFKLFIKKNKIYMFFPGNPCSSFVLTNIIIKSLIEIYNNRKFQIKYDLMNINKVKFNFIKIIGD